MKRLDCATDTLDLTFPPCGGSTPEAELCRLHHTSVPLVRTETGFRFPAPFPSHIPFPARGVWTLTVTTGCGCYTAHVYVDCPPPAFTAEHTATEAVGPSTECCVPDGALAFTVTALDPPTVEPDTYTLAVDEAAAYTLTLTLTELPADTAYRWLDADGYLLAEGTSTSEGATQPHDIDLTCGDYYIEVRDEPDPAQ